MCNDSWGWVDGVFINQMMGESAQFNVLFIYLYYIKRDM